MCGWCQMETVGICYQGHSLDEAGSFISTIPGNAVPHHLVTRDLPRVLHAAF